MLFFESSQQTIPFLSAVIAGFCLALLLELPIKKGFFQVLSDFAAVVFSAAILIAFLLYSQAGKIRLFFLLGVVVGIFLYLKGSGKVLQKVKKMKKNHS